MTVREFYIERRRAETPVFLNVLKALPADRLGYRPHDRSPSAEQLVWTLTSELRHAWMWPLSTRPSGMPNQRHP